VRLLGKRSKSSLARFGANDAYGRYINREIASDGGLFSSAPLRVHLRSLILTPARKSRASR
jgi:hypothetical protein